jgi:hypothetical protein
MGLRKLPRLELSPELVLAAACCTDAPAQILSNGRSLEAIDWTRFLRVVRRNRIDPLVNRSLSRAGLDPPKFVGASLQATALTATAENLHYAAASDQILQAFRKAGIKVTFVKGLTLSALAYGTATLKMGWDIDILVPHGQLFNAAGILRSLGYRCTNPGPDFALNPALKPSTSLKESVWINERSSVFVELHTRLSDNAELIPRIDAHSRTRNVNIVGGIDLPTLCDEELFAYLCVHGASSAWFRLKWLADLNALLRKKSPEQINELYIASQILGAGRAADQALLLSEKLFATNLPTGLKSDLDSVISNKLLVAISIFLLDGGRPDRELEGKILGTLPIHIAQFLLLPSLGFKLSEFRRQLMTAKFGYRAIETHSS